MRTSIQVKEAEITLTLSVYDARDLCILLNRDVKSTDGAERLKHRIIDALGAYGINKDTKLGGDLDT